MPKISLTDFTTPISSYNGNICHWGDDEEGDTEFDMKEYGQSLANKLWDKIGWKLVEVLALYGITAKGIEFWSPQYYNYQGDSLDLDYDIAIDCYRPEVKQTAREKLDAELWYYINNVREPSRDGYCSLEGDRPSGYDWNDAGMIWAILKHEGVLYDLKDAVNDLIEESYDVYSSL